MIPGGDAQIDQTRRQVQALLVQVFEIDRYKYFVFIAGRDSRFITELFGGISIYFRQIRSR
jgi:hypothetical protein